MAGDCKKSKLHRILQAIVITQMMSTGGEGRNGRKTVI